MNMKHLLLFSALFLASCGHSGPLITACVVDAKNEGFQCAQKDKKFFIKFEDGTNLICVSPTDIEQLLKACKQHKIIQTTECKWTEARFLCVDPDGNHHQEIPDLIDNYFCVSEKDKRRILERCK